MDFWDFFYLFFIFTPLFIAWVYTVVDIFMRPDIGALAKFLWVLLGHCCVGRSRGAVPRV